MSRVELARHLSLVASTAGLYVDRLIERGYLIESRKTTRGLGRPPVMLELNPLGGRFIGLDFDARQMMVATVDLAQQPLSQTRRTIPARATAERVLSMIEDVLAEAIAAGGHDILGIGLGVPGTIDPTRGVSLSYDFIPGWKNVAIGPRVAAKFGLPVFVENNIRSIAVGELWSGGGRGLRDLVCLGIRSGIGMGIITGGKLLGGANNRAGEIGRWTCPNFPPANGSRKRAKPSRQTIEDVASLTAMLRTAAGELAAGAESSMAESGHAPTAGDLVTAANAGDELATSIIRDAAPIHGWVVDQLGQLLDPEKIFIAGPLVEANNYIEAVRAAAIESGGAELGPRIVPSTLGRFGGALGARRWRFITGPPAASALSKLDFRSIDLGKRVPCPRARGHPAWA